MEQNLNLPTIDVHVKGCCISLSVFKEAAIVSKGTVFEHFRTASLHLSCLFHGNYNILLSSSSIVWDNEEFKHHLFYCDVFIWCKN
jgi:hypothetical protein